MLTPTAPARTALHYTIDDTSSNQSPFVGEPRPELDAAWSNLLRCEIADTLTKALGGSLTGPQANVNTASKIRILENEMLRMNKTSIALRDGTGYIGYLESIHMLHCVVCNIVSFCTFLTVGNGCAAVETDLPIPPPSALS